MAGDNEVGYRKPPQHSRFKKGRSGNPKGRPRGAKNLRTDLLEELGERIVIREGNREIRVSKQRALLKSQTARSLKGDTRAAGQIIDLYLKLVGLEAEAAEADMPLTADERAVVANLEERILRKAGIGPPVDRSTPDKTAGDS
jgi:hypothetical protein